jgi:serine protease AprX
MQLRRFLFIIIGIYTLGCLQPVTPNSYARGKIAPTLQAFYAAASGQPTEFVVVLNAQTSASSLLAAQVASDDWAQLGWAVYRRLRATADASQAPVIAELKRRGLAYRSYWLVNQIVVTGNEADALALGARSDVARVDSDAPFKVDLPDQSTQPSPALLATSGTEWNINWINANDLWAMGVNGSGIIVASADTGAQWDHPALRDSYAGWNGSIVDHNYHWWDAVHSNQGSPITNICGYNRSVPCDDHGHGSHTIGIMAGQKSLSTGNNLGVAPGAKWIACRNMDSGYGTPSSYIECLQFFLAPTDLAGNNPNPSRRPHIINNSYACNEASCTSTVLHTALANLRSAGIMVVAAAGNSGLLGCNSINYPPGNDPSSLAVGATTTSSDGIASYSSRGSIYVSGTLYTKPDLVAPGSGVLSVNNSNGYLTLSGTSMASPHVAGAVALLWSAFPADVGNVSHTVDLLTQSARPLYTTESCGGDSLASHPNNTYGWGALDVLAAYQLEQSLSGYRYYMPLLTRAP